jgi:hypothetical protein
VPAHLLGSPTRWRDFGGAGAVPVFGPEPNFHAGRVLGVDLGPPMEML